MNHSLPKAFFLIIHKNVSSMQHLFLDGLLYTKKRQVGAYAPTCLFACKLTYSFVPDTAPAAFAPFAAVPVVPAAPQHPVNRLLLRHTGQTDFLIVSIKNLPCDRRCAITPEAAIRYNNRYRKLRILCRRISDKDGIFRPAGCYVLLGRSRFTPIAVLKAFKALGVNLRHALLQSLSNKLPECLPYSISQA